MIEKKRNLYIREMSLIDEITVECIIPLQQMQLEKLVFQLAIKCEKAAEILFAMIKKCFIQHESFPTRIFFRRKNLHNFLHNGIHNNDTIRYTCTRFLFDTSPPFVFSLLTKRNARSRTISRYRQYNN